MADKDIKNEELQAMQEEAEEVNVVVLTADQGNEGYFMEEMIIPYNGKKFLLLLTTIAARMRIASAIIMKRMRMITALLPVLILMRTAKQFM